MKLLKKSTYLKKSNNNWSLISSLTVLGFLFTPVAIANVNVSVLFQPPPEAEQPETTEGAASRHNGQCFPNFLSLQQQQASDDRLKITAIVPDSN